MREIIVNEVNSYMLELRRMLDPSNAEMYSEADIKVQVIGFIYDYGITQYQNKRSIVVETVELCIDWLNARNFKDIVLIDLRNKHYGDKRLISFNTNYAAYLDSKGLIFKSTKEEFYTMLKTHEFQETDYSEIMPNSNLKVLFKTKELVCRNIIRGDVLFDILKLEKELSAVYKPYIMKGVRNITEPLNSHQFANLLKELKRASEEVLYVEYKDLCKNIGPLTMDIDKATGNKKRKTFDFIRVHIPLCSMGGRDNQRDFVKRNSEELKKVAVSKIKESKRFSNMGIPLEFLRLSKGTIRADSVLEFTFELKIVSLSVEETVCDKCGAQLTSTGKCSNPMCS